MLSSLGNRTATVMFVALFLFALPAFAHGSEEMGRLKIHVSPKQAYVFVDGEAIRDGSHTIRLVAGLHEISVRNYGFVPNTQKVDIGAGETTHLDVALEPSGDMVPGPFGEIEFKGHPRSAVLLNGTTPDYFVGHVDEFDWNWVWHQRLLVHPGTYHVIVTREGKTIWTGPVAVSADQRVIVYLDRNGESKTKNWPEGNSMPPQRRFRAGIATATVPVAPVMAQLGAQSTHLGCGQTTELKWKSADAVAVSITNLGGVPASGDRVVSPSKTTQYELLANGPGGEVTHTTTVQVATQPMATISVSQPVVHYHRIGDKVVQDDSATLKWSTSNASNVTITSLGNEPLSGSQTVMANPNRTGEGSVNELIPYHLTASNSCGGSTDQTAILRVVGSIDPPPAVTLASVFYPTDYPKQHYPNVGLVVSEEQTLSQAANTFKKHEQYDNDHASLTIVGHADVRGSKRYNLRLSERRADAVKSYLVSQGIPADEIQIRAEGKTEQVSRQRVIELQSADTQMPEKWMIHRPGVTWLAYNRRVDIILEPVGKQSTENYPNDVSDARLLWQRQEPSLKAVELAAKSKKTSGSLRARLIRN